MDNKDNSSSSTCVCKAEKKTMTTEEVEAEGYVHWVLDDEAEGDDDEELCWVRDEENGVDVEAERDDDVITEEIIEGGRG